MWKNGCANLENKNEDVFTFYDLNAKKVLWVQSTTYNDKTKYMCINHCHCQQMFKLQKISFKQILTSTCITCCIKNLSLLLYSNSRFKKTNESGIIYYAINWLSLIRRCKFWNNSKTSLYYIIKLGQVMLK